MKIRFYKTCEINGSSYVKIPLKSSASINIKNDDKYCFIWSILVKLQPCENDHPNRKSKYRQNFDELNIEGFHFINGLRFTDVQRFAKLNNLFINIFDLNFYQDENKWKRNLIPIEISKNDESDRVVDWLIYKSHYALIKKLNVILGDHKKFFSVDDVLFLIQVKICYVHKQKCENNDITTTRSSPVSHILWKNHFHKSILFWNIRWFWSW